MAYTNSSLISYTRISPNRNSPRNQPISKITIHHCAGVLSVEQFGNIVAPTSRQMSANYCIGNDGRIGLFCPESDRSWCSSSAWNDNRAITIEVSNSAYGDASGWPVSDAAYASLIKLCVDICKRNGIKKLEFTGDTSGSLTYHYMLAATSCLPIDRTELLTPSGWKLLKDIQLGDVVATVHIDNLGIKFDSVENIVPVKTQDTYTTRDFEATSDHRVVYYNSTGRQYVGLYKELYDNPNTLYFPNAGFIENPEGFRGLGDADIEFLVAVQADGHYMVDGNSRYGVEFHVKKARKIKRLKQLLDALGYEYTQCNQSDGTVKFRLYGTNYVDMCEDYLDNKCFTWEWLNMNRKQVDCFMEAILQYDGCKANNSYASAIPQNIDIVQAIAAINGIGTKLSTEHDRVYFKKDRRSLGDNVRTRKQRQQVSCVTVRSGFILIRQHGRTTVTGNCPGPWIKAHTQDICNKVNAQLGATSTPVNSSTTTTTSSGKFAVGDLVKINTGARYYNGGAIPAWVLSDQWYVSSIKGDRVVLGNNKAKNQNIQSPIKASSLTLVTAANPAPAVKELYKIKLEVGKPIYKDIGKAATDKIKMTTTYTIVEEKTVGNIVYGKLKSGVGWVEVKKLERTYDINNKDDVKALQKALNAKGYNCGTVDGVIGSKTTTAMFSALCKMLLG